MKKIAVLLFILLPFAVYAQEEQHNILHSQAFWKENPDVAKVKAAIDKGASPSEVNDHGGDAVSSAINAQASLDVVKFLLEQKGVDIKRNTGYGRTYMFPAATRGNIELMKYLASKGLQMNKKDSLGMSPFTVAAMGGLSKTEVYDLLIANGVDPKKEQYKGANAILLSAPYAKDMSLINYFVDKGLDIKNIDSAGKTAFDYAVRGGNVPVLKELVAKGIKYNPNAFLFTAQGGGRGFQSNVTLETYQYLDELKLDPKVTSPEGDNMLHLIARRTSQPEIIKFFIDKGVDANLVNKAGNTPFMQAAASNRNLEVLKVYLSQVKNINITNETGANALALAVRGNSPEAVQLLLDNGADIKVVDKAGYNLAYYLIPNFARTPEAFDAKLKILEGKGFNIAANQPNGTTLYLMVLEKNGVDLLKRLESFKADVNATNKEKLTPLHKAALIAKDDQILKYLVSIGAKKDAQTEFGETPYDLAKENELLKKNNTSIDFLK